MITDQKATVGAKYGSNEQIVLKTPTINPGQSKRGRPTTHLGVQWKYFFAPKFIVSTGVSLNQNKECCCSLASKAFASYICDRA